MINYSLLAIWFTTHLFYRREATLVLENVRKNNYCSLTCSCLSVSDNDMYTVFLLKCAAKVMLLFDETKDLFGFFVWKSIFLHT